MYSRTIRLSKNYVNGLVRLIKVRFEIPLERACRSSPIGLRETFVGGRVENQNKRGNLSEFHAIVAGFCQLMAKLIPMYEALHPR